ncbi:MAG: cytochrome c-type biogenesis protein CcmH [Myxococcota bacterium]
MLRTIFASLVLSLLLILPHRLWADGEDTSLVQVSLSPIQASLARDLKGEVMAPCCWHGTVDHHNSPVAAKIANQIDVLVSQGKGRQEVLDAMTTEYGERILARPRTQGFGLLFYVAPAVVVSLTGLFLWRWVRRNAQSTEAPAPASPLSPAAPGAAPPTSDAFSAQFEARLKNLD